MNAYKQGDPVTPENMEEANAFATSNVRLVRVTEDPATWPLIEEELRAQDQFKSAVRMWEVGLILAYWTIMALLGGFIFWLIYLIWL